MRSSASAHCDRNHGGGADEIDRCRFRQSTLASHAIHLRLNADMCSGLKLKIATVVIVV